MPFHIKDGGVWKKPTGYFTKLNGAWTPIKEAFVKEGGVWKRYWPAMTSEKLALVVSGGGRGSIGGWDGSESTWGGGGGGGGGVVEGKADVVSGVTYTVTVGGPGQMSTFAGISPNPGSDGYVTNNPPVTSGWGVGGASGNGHPGGNPNAYDFESGGGGGGASGPGSVPPDYGYGGAGGSGIISNITGQYYGGGGGGGGPNESSTGGNGGGGNGYGPDRPSGPGAPNTGGGGGAGWAQDYWGGDGSGGSGIVVIRTPDSDRVAAVTGGCSISTSGSFRLYTFTSSGTILFDP